MLNCVGGRHNKPKAIGIFIGTKAHILAGTGIIFPVSELTADLTPYFAFHRNKFTSFLVKSYF
jgi:hypothetical protein